MNGLWDHIQSSLKIDDTTESNVKRRWKGRNDDQLAFNIYDAKNVLLNLGTNYIFSHPEPCKRFLALTEYLASPPKSKELTHKKGRISSEVNKEDIARYASHKIMQWSIKFCYFLEDHSIQPDTDWTRE